MHKPQMTKFLIGQRGTLKLMCFKKEVESAIGNSKISAYHEQVDDRLKTGN